MAIYALLVCTETPGGRPDDRFAVFPPKRPTGFPVRRGAGELPFPKTPQIAGNPSVRHRETEQELTGKYCFIFILNGMASLLKLPR